MYTCSPEAMGEKIKAMSAYGATRRGGITRYALSGEDLGARAGIIKRMKAIGAVIEIDDFANVYATIAGSEPRAKRIVMASHSDSVKCGGNYDGILGVIAAMEVLETVVKRGIPHRHPLTAKIWTSEEGSLYPPAMMSSGVVCHDWLPESVRG